MNNHLLKFNFPYYLHLKKNEKKFPFKITNTSFNKSTL